MQKYREHTEEVYCKWTQLQRAVLCRSLPAENCVASPAGRGYSRSKYELGELVAIRESNSHFILLIRTTVDDENGLAVVLLPMSALEE